MKKFISLILITFQLSFVSIITAQNKNTLLNMDRNGIVIPFKLVNNKTILPVKMNGLRKLNIILDSGMGWDGLLIMNPDLRDSIKLVGALDVNLGGAGSGKAQTALMSDSMNFSIGEAKFNNQRIVILKGDSYKGFKNDGVTGNSLFGHYTVLVNYDNLTLTLYEPGTKINDYTWYEIPITLNLNNIPCINVKIAIENEEPIPILCYIDYASSEAIELLIKGDQKFTLPKETKDYYLGRGLSGDINGKRGKIAKVIIGNFELSNVEAAFAPAEVRSKQKVADGVIANNLLRRFNLIFDYGNKKLYLKPNNSFYEKF